MGGGRSRLVHSLSMKMQPTHIFYLCDLSEPLGSPIHTGNPNFEVACMPAFNSDCVWDIMVGKWKGKLVFVHRIKNPSFARSNYQPSNFEVQVRRFSYIRHPNIVSIIGGSFGAGEYLYVTDYFGNGTLHMAIVQSKLTTEKNKSKILKGIAAGIRFLHSLIPPVIIGKLYPSTIGLEADFNPVIDKYGFLNIDNTERRHALRAGDEFIQDPTYLGGFGLTVFCDIYSFGLLMTAVWRCEIPFDGVYCLEILYGTMRGERPPLPTKAPNGFNELATRCWDAALTNRPSIDDIIRELDRIFD